MKIVDTKTLFLWMFFPFFASSPGTPLALNLRGVKGQGKPQRREIWATMASNSLFSSVTPCQQTFFWGKCPRFSLCFWPCGIVYNKDLCFERQQSCVDVYKHSARPASESLMACRNQCREDRALECHFRCNAYFLGCASKCRAAKSNIKATKWMFDIDC